MIEFARSKPIIAPFAAPTAIPSASGARIDTRVRPVSIGCICTDTTAARVKIAPTERSKLPEIRTTTTPIATIPTIETCRRILRRLPVVRKLDEIMESSAIVPTSTSQTHSRRIRAVRCARLVPPPWATRCAVGSESEDIGADQFLACLIPGHLCDQTPVAHYNDPMAQQQYFREFRRNEHDRRTLPGEHAQEFVNLGFSPDIDPTSRLIDDKNFRSNGQP